MTPMLRFRLRLRLAFAFSLLSLPCLAAPHLGHVNLFKDVHGYERDGVLLAPMRGLAEWLGATVDYAPPRITATKGGSSVSLTVGSNQAEIRHGGAATLFTMPQPATVYGSTLCVPLRFFAEALGAGVKYESRGPEAERIGVSPVVIVTDGDRTARILVHHLPPDVVQSVVSNLDVKGRFIDDWTIALLDRSGDYIYAVEPFFWEVDKHIAPEGAYLSTLSGEGADVILGYRSGKWKPLVFPGGIGVTRGLLHRFGVPESIARKFGVKIEPD